MPRPEETHLETLVQTDVEDLRQYPKPITVEHPTVVLGDLHGSSLKLLYILLKYLIVSWDDSEKLNLYRQFYHLYHAPITADSLKHISELIGKLKINPNSPSLIFLGDELADRGNNDIFTLLLFQHLHRNKVSFRHTFSNHVLVFFQLFNKIMAGESIPLVNPDFYRSVLSLLDCVRHKLINLEELQALVSTFEQHIDLVGCTFSEGAISLYTHAPADIRVFPILAKRLDVPYDESNIEQLARSIYSINEKFRHQFRENLDIYFTQEGIDLSFTTNEVPLGKFPFIHVVLNRNYTGLQRPKIHPEFKYTINYGHGHDIEDPIKASHIYNLDNYFAKTAMHYQEKNPVLYSSEEECGAFFSDSDEFVSLEAFLGDLDDDKESSIQSSEKPEPGPPERPVDTVYIIDPAPILANFSEISQQLELARNKEDVDSSYEKFLKLTKIPEMLTLVKEEHSVLIKKFTEIYRILHEIHIHKTLCFYKIALLEGAKKLPSLRQSNLLTQLGKMYQAFSNLSGREDLLPQEKLRSLEHENDKILNLPKEEVQDLVELMKKDLTSDEILIVNKRVRELKILTTIQRPGLSLLRDPLNLIELDKQLLNRKRIFCSTVIEKLKEKCLEYQEHLISKVYSYGLLISPPTEKLDIVHAFLALLEKEEKSPLEKLTSFYANYLSCKEKLQIKRSKVPYFFPQSAGENFCMDLDNTLAPHHSFLGILSQELRTQKPLIHRPVGSPSR